MDGTSEYSAGSVSLLRCPLFLLEEDTVGELETLLTDLRGGGYTLLSMRELFRCRRGLLGWPVHPCAVLLRNVPFAALLPILPVLRRLKVTVGVFCRTPYAPQEAEALRGCEWLQFFAEAGASDADPIALLPNGENARIAAFCERADTSAAAFFRKTRIWMAVTTDRDFCALPGVEDILPVIPVKRGMRLPELMAYHQTALFPRRPDPAVSIRLPLNERPMLSEPSLAVPLCILGDRPEVPATVDWTPVFNASEGTYHLDSAWKRLASEQIPQKETTPEGFRRLLGEGRYVFLQTQMLPAGLLLFGCDGERDVFLAMMPLRPGTYDRTNFQTHRLERYCADPSCVATCLTPVAVDDAVLSAREAVRFLTADSLPAPEDGVYRGREASVAFANRTLTPDASVSASDLRLFIEERMLVAYRLRFFSMREDLYLPTLDGYQALLESEGAEVLQGLRGRTAPEASSLLRIGSLMQKLLNVETFCGNAFLEELDRAERRRAYQREKGGQNR